ncbi:flagellar filament capping protein FliD [Aliarcobacter lanthieri]|uniref:flagellar filament capping protein FliD n=1 Tax=Aliarcobacter lanthieri TaxID=1355374 RepID=UPI000478E8BB|nr:flagellar filament capping protein FliD [Aliarcobacter lanthieri]QKF58378.1 flagellar filament cap protein [Aliarcobacter lanthieri]
MADGVLGLGSGQAASLNNDLIDKLKAAEKKATVDPLEKKLENFSTEKEVISNIGTKVDNFLKAVEVFSLNQSSGVNSFNQKSANVMGDGVVFDSDDLSALKTGSLSVKVEQLAQKDAWQTDVVSGSKSDLVNKGDLVINGKTINTDGMTYSKLAEEINKIDGIQASLVDSSSGGFRLSIKSTETGSANALNLSGNAANELFKVNETDPEVLKNYHVLVAQDMKMKVDGIEYSNSTNTVTIDGLKITATKTGGESTINIENDTTTLAKQMQDFATAYNDLRAEIENEIYSSESTVYDKSALRDMLSQIKGNLFSTGNSDKSLFSFGFSFDEKSGNLNFSTKDFEESIKNGTKDLENLFAGVPEKKGIATLLDETISINGVKKGLIDYELNMLSREEAMKKEKETAQTTLDNKYALMAQQFASYGVIINQMEASFSGLKMMIQQSTASK